MWMQAHEGFDSFISQAEKDLGIKIHIEKCPATDNRQAKIATLLTSGDDSVDLITVNDEMISEFKHKGISSSVGRYGYDRGDSGEFSAGIPERNMHVRRTYFFGTISGWISWHSGNQELLDQAGLDRLSCLSDLGSFRKASEYGKICIWGCMGDFLHI